jgi:hypothetical protein
MDKLQKRSGWTLLVSALASAAALGTLAAIGPIGFIYRSAPGLAFLRGLAQIMAYLGGAALGIVLLIVGLQAALPAAPWGKKLLHALPLFTLGLALAGVVEFAGHRQRAVCGWLAGHFCCAGPGWRNSGDFPAAGIGRGVEDNRGRIGPGNDF